MQSSRLHSGHLARDDLSSTVGESANAWSSSAATETGRTAVVQEPVPSKCGTRVPAGDVTSRGTHTASYS